LEFRVHATDPDSDSIILKAENIPMNGSFVDSGNGAGSFTFTPDNTQSGIYNVSFIATDIAGAADTEMVAISVQDPNILSLSNAVGSPGDTDISVDVNLHNVEPMAGAQMRIVLLFGCFQHSGSHHICHELVLSKGCNRHRGRADSPINV
jgi:hypothetical protein